MNKESEEKLPMIINIKDCPQCGAETTTWQDMTGFVWTECDGCGGL